MQIQYFELNKIEQDVRPEDLSVLMKGGEENPLPDLLRIFGPGPIVMMAKYFKSRKKAGGRIWINDYDSLTRAARDRDFEESLNTLPSSLPTELTTP